jgi:hypothetical protein
MKLLYLSPNMVHYGGANYQHDVMEELRRQADVSFYGPGFDAYNSIDTIDDVVRKAGFRPDWIVCGHSWLEDKPGAAVERFGHLDLAATDIPRAAILNKEYTNLREKLAWFRRTGVSVVFSHHHGAARYEEPSGARCVVWPFAADHRLFHADDPKQLDLGFSGILQNPTPGNQSDLRVRIMQRLFECEGDLPVRLRPWCAHLRVRFNALPRSEPDRAMAASRGLYRHMAGPEYAAFVRGCRVFVCTRSPADLVSPRYFECMLSRTLVLAERSPAHAAMFPPGCLVEFDDEAGFQERLLAMLDGDAAAEIVDRAHRAAVRGHTWEGRIKDLLAQLATTPVLAS